MRSHILIPFLVGCLTWGCAGKTESPMPSPAPPPQPRSAPEVEITNETFIEIRLEGGGVFGGINPVTGRQSLIGTDGEIAVDLSQHYSGRQETTYRVSRLEVEQLARFICDQGFFMLEESYDCSDSDPNCWRARKKYPRPAPLSLDITIGDRRAKVEVAVFDPEIVDYPTGLQAIVDSINATVGRVRAGKRQGTGITPTGLASTSGSARAGCRLDPGSPHSDPRPPHSPPRRSVPPGP